MAIGLTKSVQVVGYVPEVLRQRAKKLRQFDDNLSLSRLIEEGLQAAIDRYERKFFRRRSKA